MAEFDDGYASYYANRLWQLLPGVYRAQDSAGSSLTGPLQELVTRIGAQVAVVRRSIDRLWADQSIETCDDWVIPYIGGLLDTNLVNGLDPAAQRLDVAKTIHYRRRKGTVAILEELARDVTNPWDAHLVEGFRRLSRTRHNLDPPVGTARLSAALPVACPGSAAAANPPDPSGLLSHEGLIGALTGTLAGGFADLRSLHGAALADSPFDEFFHTADLRLGQGAVGRYGIPKLIVFLWRLRSFTVAGGTPVKINACANQYVFDPTGRNVQLFLPEPPPKTDDFADLWTSATEWQVSGPLTNSLQRALADPGASDLPPHAPYPDAPSLSSFFGASSGTPSEPAAIEVWPEAGQLELQSTLGEDFNVTYSYGFPAMIGAGPYDRTQLGDPPFTVGIEQNVKGGAGLDAALKASAGVGTVTIQDSLTYDAVWNVGSTAAPVGSQPVGSLLVRAGPGVRPVVRLPLPAAPSQTPVTWVFTGGSPDGQLILDGLFLSGGDIVLRGAFATVRVTGCTTDPGTLNETGAAYATSVDDRALAPVRIWIEADPDAPDDAPGAVSTLTIDNCVLGPIRTRSGGAVETVCITDSIVQGIAPAAGGTALTAADVYDAELLARALWSADPLSQLVLGRLPAAAQAAISAYKTAYETGTPGSSVLAPASLTAIVDGFNSIIAGSTSIYDAAAFTGVQLTPDASELLAQGSAVETAALNRALLESGFPVALSPAAIALAEGELWLAGVTTIGRCFVHRLQASDSLLSDFTVAQDTQDGCVRFSAVSVSSSVPRQYCSVTIETDAALFTTTAFGEPAFGQLLETADRAIVGGATNATITAGAETGSEMGAFSSQLAPIKQGGLLIKYAEYMPLGLTPVVVHVT